jgi:hypothetical protein
MGAAVAGCMPAHLHLLALLALVQLLLDLLHVVGDVDVEGLCVYEQSSVVKRRQLCVLRLIRLCDALQGLYTLLPVPFV